MSVLLVLPSVDANGIGRTEGLPLCDGRGIAVGAAVGTEAGMRTLSSDFPGGHLEVSTDKKYLSNDWQ